jgi:hypothetical protein
MPSPDAVYVFNWPALALGGTTMLLCLVVQAGFVVTVMTASKAWIRTLVAEKKKVRAQAVFFLGILMLLLSHLAQIYIWGLSINMTGIVADKHSAIILAGSTYTTIGFVADPLPQQWQLLLVIMATSGFFGFGWSTSIMFNLSRFLYPMEN